MNSNNSKVFASSDHHYFHRNIIKYCDRPFDFDDPNCVADNAKMMLERHNETISNDDYWMCLGDLSAGLKGRQVELAKLIGVMNGRKILVRGNHDHEPDQFYLDAGFIAVVDYIHIDEYFINHYPCVINGYSKPRDHERRGIVDSSGAKVILHGHTHNKPPQHCEKYLRVNYAVDYVENNFYPKEISVPKIVEYIKTRYK
jgi:calcineurin-like phosphoesterase family protein